MNNIIQQQIIHKMKQQNLSASALEKKAHLKRGIISSITRGISSNPSAQTLIALSKTLGCSIDELLHDTNLTLDPSSDTDPFDSKLFIDAANILHNLITIQNKSLPVVQAIAMIKEVYLYSKNKNISSIDTDFAKWLIHKL